MDYSSLGSMFGVPHSTLSRILNAAEDALTEALKGYAPARIVWPTLKRQKALARLTAAREPLLPFTWGFIDGKNFRVQKPPQGDIQNAHYNGWLHAVYVTGTLCFSADGLIVWSKHNCPGSWNDADTSLQFREILLDPECNPHPRFDIIADSAFPCGADMVGRIMTPLKEGDLAWCRRSAPLRNSCQTIKWGMGSVEKVYHRLLQPLPYDVNKRRQRLDNLFRLANYRVRIVERSLAATLRPANLPRLFAVMFASALGCLSQFEANAFALFEFQSVGLSTLLPFSSPVSLLGVGPPVAILLEEDEHLHHVCTS
uniref:DDE Tnp4 domain-containing protein n=1 Tax=Phytophthora ramorum TaxID=164328 RepID=H3GMZ8_PHYRM